MRIYREQFDKGRQWLRLEAGWWHATRRDGSGRVDWMDLDNDPEAQELFLLDLLDSMGVSVEPRADGNQ